MDPIVGNQQGPEAPSVWQRIALPGAAFLAGLLAAKAFNELSEETPRKESGQSAHASKPLDAPPIELHRENLPNITSRRELASAEISPSNTETQAIAPDPQTLDCSDPRFWDALDRLTPLLTKALEECGSSPDALLSPKIRDILHPNPNDKIHAAPAGERAEIVGDTLFSMRSQLTWFLGDKLNKIGVPPYQGELDIPEGNFAANEQGILKIEAADGSIHLFFRDTVNGIPCVREVPPEWEEGKLILALHNLEAMAYETFIEDP